MLLKNFVANSNEIEELKNKINIVRIEFYTTSIKYKCLMKFVPNYSEQILTIFPVVANNESNA